MSSKNCVVTLGGIPSSAKMWTTVGRSFSNLSHIHLWRLLSKSFQFHSIFSYVSVWRIALASDPQLTILMQPATMVASTILVLLSLVIIGHHPLSYFP